MSWKEFCREKIQLKSFHATTPKKGIKRSFQKKKLINIYSFLRESSQSDFENKSRNKGFMSKEDSNAG